MAHVDDERNSDRDSLLSFQKVKSCGDEASLLDNVAFDRS
jgi:hypothetical protein